MQVDQRKDRRKYNRKGMKNMWCPNCGEKLEDDCVFCPACGVRVQEEQDVLEEEFGCKEPEKKANMPLVIIVIIVVVSLLLGVGAYFFVSGSRSGEKASAEQETVKKETEKASEDEKDTEEESEDSGANEAGADAGVPAVISADLISTPASVDPYVKLGVASATATSVIDQEGHDNSAAMVLDGRDETSWQEGVPGNGVGEGITLRFDRECKVKYMSFKLGNWRTEDYYWQNNRPKMLEIRTGNSTSLIVFPDAKTEHWIAFSDLCPTSEIQLTIKEVYQGSSTKWNDACIAGIEIYGSAQ